MFSRAGVPLFPKLGVDICTLTNERLDADTLFEAGQTPPTLNHQALETIEFLGKQIFNDQIFVTARCEKDRLLNLTRWVEECKLFKKLGINTPPDYRLAICHRDFKAELATKYDITDWVDLSVAELGKMPPKVGLRIALLPETTDIRPGLDIQVADTWQQIGRLITQSFQIPQHTS